MIGRIGLGFCVMQRFSQQRRVLRKSQGVGAYQPCAMDTRAERGLGFGPIVGEMMKQILCAAAVASILFGGNAFASQTANVKAAVRHLIADSNSGNDEAFKADLTEPALFFDEYPPFDWIGAKDGWLNAYNAYNKQNAVTAAKTTPLAFRHVNVSGDRAYVVLRSLYTYREDGKAQKEPGTEVFTLTKTGGKWLANGYAWLSADGIDTGVDATAAVAAVHTAVDAINSGKADPATLGWKGVIDEFPPYNWQGATATSDWFAAFGKSAAAIKQTDNDVILGTPTHLDLNGSCAYLVIPSTVASKIKGRPVKEKGSLVFVLQKSAGAWHIDSMAWATD
jgi:ketosteroid isomerase-like protein